MRKAFHKPCALTPCAHSGAGGVAFLATSLGPPAGVTAKLTNFRIKQTGLWKINFRAGSLNYMFNTRVSMFSDSKFSENQFRNFQLARFFAPFLAFRIHVFLVCFFFFEIYLFYLLGTIQGFIYLFFLIFETCSFCPFAPFIHLVA